VHSFVNGITSITALSKADSKMILQGKHYKVQYDENLLEVEVSTIFEDQVIVVLRKHNCDE